MKSKRAYLILNQKNVVKYSNWNLDEHGKTLLMSQFTISEHAQRNQEH